MEADERNRLTLAIATARSWLDGLVREQYATSPNSPTAQSQLALDPPWPPLAFLDPTLIDAACAGTLPRGYGVEHLMDLPPRFADQWRALGMQRPA